jgi:hypothetical protein
MGNWFSAFMSVYETRQLLKSSVWPDSFKKVGKARLTLPPGNAIYPVTVKVLKQIGVAYYNCGPLDVSRFLFSFQQQVKELEKETN